MSRKSFADILNSAGVDIAKEYHRLIVLFYRSPDAYRTTLEEYVKQTFLHQDGSLNHLQVLPPEFLLYQVRLQSIQ